MTTFLEQLTRGLAQQAPYGSFPPTGSEEPPAWWLQGQGGVPPGFGAQRPGGVDVPPPPAWPYPVTSEATAGANPYTEIQPLGLAPQTGSPLDENPWVFPPGSIPVPPATGALGLAETPPSGQLMGSYADWGQMYAPPWIHQLPGPLRDAMYRVIGAQQAPPLPTVPGYNWQ